MASGSSSKTVTAPAVRKIGLTTSDRKSGLARSFLILRHSHESAAALSDALTTVRTARSAKGALTDEEQDLLRAMLIMSTSGLDAMVKQMLRELLPALCRSDEAVLKGLTEFVRRELRDDGEGHLNTEAPKLLATWLTSESVREAAIEHYVNSLTADSLQSSEQLLKATAALGLASGIVDKKTLDPVFRDRNMIIHELDIDFDAPTRNRRSRKIADMTDHTNRVLGLAEALYTAGEGRLP